MNKFMWADHKKDLEMQNVSNFVNQFFDHLRDHQLTLDDGTKLKLTYRISQRQLARDIMRTIRDNDILVVQAGVGIGKTYAYLIPVLQTIGNVSNFNRVVISTSSIALQQQLLTDINFISNFMGIEVKTAIAKGVNNYVCLRRVEELMTTGNIEDADKDLLLDIRTKMQSMQTIDRDELIGIRDDIWRQIQMNNRGACSRCNYSRNCLYRNISKDVMSANIVITNHGNFVRSLLDDRDYIQSADMFVFDEAHKLESSIQGIEQGFLNLNVIRSQIDFYLDNCLFDSNYANKNAADLITAINSLFSKVRNRTSGYFKSKNDTDRDTCITDCDKIPLQIHGLSCFIHPVVSKLEQFIQDAKKVDYYQNNSRISILEEYLTVFKDMDMGKNSENIYWANYYQNNRIYIGYVPKRNIYITKDIFQKDIPIVCTSATLVDANGGYDYFKKGLSINEMQFTNHAVIDGRVYPSPYDYEKNSLFYYDSTVANPKNNYRDYINDLVVKISELIRITNGRTLILFTAKSTMEYVYQAISQEQFDFPLLMQGTMSDAQVYRKFEKDVKSCLFATGVFWEGIDVAGKSLCNVIITRLPFDNMDAITLNKASQFSKEEAFKMVYLNNMVQKIAQGTGRLIRSTRDKGVVCCLDSRFIRYIEVIKKCTPFCNFTNNIADVYDFSDKYITNRDKKRKVKEL